MFIHFTNSSVCVCLSLPQIFWQCVRFGYCAGSVSSHQSVGSAPVKPAPMFWCAVFGLWLFSQGKVTSVLQFIFMLSSTRVAFVYLWDISQREDEIENSGHGARLVWLFFSFLVVLFWKSFSIFQENNLNILNILKVTLCVQLRVQLDTRFLSVFQL